jgi:hypothetical protein
VSFILSGFHTLAHPVSINIDGTQTHQSWEGFGATMVPEYYDVDVLTPSQRARAVDALFNQVKIRVGQAPTVVEAPSTGANYYNLRQNDNNDALSLNWAGLIRRPGTTSSA